MDGRTLVTLLQPRSPAMPSGRPKRRERSTKRVGLAPRAELAIEIFQQYRELRAQAPTRSYTPAQTRSSTGGGINSATVAGAIAMIDGRARDVYGRDGDTARQLFAAVWWRDAGFAIDVDQLDADLMSLLLEEWERRESAVMTTQLAAAREAARLAISSRYGDRARALQAESDARDAKRRRWPSPFQDEHFLAPVFGHIIAAALRELASASVCPDCRGTGVLISAAREEGEERARITHCDCPRCKKSGRIHMSERQRARAAGMERKRFVRHGWARVYGWLIREMWRLERLYRDMIAEALDA